MLRELHISGLGVIDDLDLPLHPGLNVLTGETGAGKTMITVGLALALGARASAIARARRRSGAARVQALFDVSAAQATRGLARGLGRGRRRAARTVRAGRRQGRASRIGGQLATASALAALGAALVEVHGQHQAQRLLEPAVQTAFLDRFAGDEHLVAVAAYRRGLRGAAVGHARALERLCARRRATRERELDLLAYQVREIEAVIARGRARSDALGRRGGAARSRRALARGRAPWPRRRSAATTARPTRSASRRARSTRRRRSTRKPGELADRAARRWRSRSRSSLATCGRIGSRSSPTPRGSSRCVNGSRALKALQRKYGETDADVLAFIGGGVGDDSTELAGRRRAARGPRRRGRGGWSDEVARAAAAVSDVAKGRAAPRLADGDPARARGARHARRDRSRWPSMPLAAAGAGGCRARRAALRRRPRGSRRMPLGEGRLGWRALPRDARVPQRAGRPRRRPHARLRRGRRRHRRTGRARRRPATRAPRAGPAGARRDAPAADRLLRRPPRPGDARSADTPRSRCSTTATACVELSRMLAGLDESSSARLPRRGAARRRPRG